MKILLILFINLIFCQNPAALYFQTNSPSGNNVRVFSIGANGNLAFINYFPTQGNGSLFNPNGADG